MIKDGARAFQEHFDVSRETLDLLERYADLLRKWNAKINLVSPSTIDSLWARHFLDSAQLWRLRPLAGHWVDIGSGGGFPGLVIAILAQERADTSVTLVESDQRKAAFLRAVIRELGLSVRIIAKRIEEIEPLSADTLSARALAPLTKLLDYASRHLRPGGTALFLKGEKADLEIVEALEGWRFACEKHASITDAKSTTLAIGEISRV